MNVRTEHQPGVLAPARSDSTLARSVRAAVRSCQLACAVAGAALSAACSADGPTESSFVVVVYSDRPTAEECKLESDQLTLDPGLYYEGRFFRRLEGALDAISGSEGADLVASCDGKEVGRARLVPFVCTKLEAAEASASRSVRETHQLFLARGGPFRLVTDPNWGRLTRTCEVVSASGDGEALATDLPTGGSCSGAEVSNDLALSWLSSGAAQFSRPTSCPAVLSVHEERRLLSLTFAGAFPDDQQWSLGVLIPVVPEQSIPDTLSCCGSVPEPWSVSATLRWQGDDLAMGAASRPATSGMLQLSELAYEAGGRVSGDIALNFGGDSDESWELEGRFSIPIVRDVSWPAD